MVAPLVYTVSLWFPLAAVSFTAERDYPFICCLQLCSWLISRSIVVDKMHAYYAGCNIGNSATLVDTHARCPGILRDAFAFIFHIPSVSKDCSQMNYVFLKTVAAQISAATTDYFPYLIICLYYLDESVGGQNESHMWCLQIARFVRHTIIN